MPSASVSVWRGKDELACPEHLPLHSPSPCLGPGDLPAKRQAPSYWVQIHGFLILLEIEGWMVEVTYVRTCPWMQESQKGCT